MEKSAYFVDEDRNAASCSSWLRTLQGTPFILTCPTWTKLKACPMDLEVSSCIKIVPTVEWSGGKKKVLLEWCVNTYENVLQKLTKPNTSQTISFLLYTLVVWGFIFQSCFMWEVYNEPRFRPSLKVLRFWGPNPGRSMGEGREICSTFAFPSLEELSGRKKFTWHRLHWGEKQKGSDDPDWGYRHTWGGEA